jgi:ABC-2 type transport system ATP-binding protein
MSETVFRAYGLTKRYGAAAALDGLDLKLESGRIYALLGEPGSGRTTLLRCAAGLVKPDSGEVEILGARGDDLYAARHEVGMLVDGPALYRDLSIRNNLKLQGRVLGDLPKGRIGKLMKALRITPRDTGNRSVGGCPAGLKMKCAIAMAMLPFPRLLLLDEVFGGLDTDDSALFRDLAEAEMAERPMALLITGQFFSELYPFATDYLLLEKGKITRTYTREELQARIPEDLHRSQELEDAFKAIRKEDAVG